VLITVSKQKGISHVGRKGIVLGKDRDWNYLYTGETGLTKKGLGWIDSYMYKSFSVIVYYETEPGSSQVRLGAFKWIRAGWKNFNMVKTRHIHNGLIRFGETYKTILEHPNLPEVSTLSREFSKISALSNETLRGKSKAYLKALKTKHANYSGHKGELCAKVFENDDYVPALKREELLSIVSLEYMKELLGMGRGFKQTLSRIYLPPE